MLIIIIIIFKGLLLQEPFLGCQAFFKKISAPIFSVGNSSFPWNNKNKKKDKLNIKLSKRKTKVEKDQYLDICLGVAQMVDIKGKLL